MGRGAGPCLTWAGGGLGLVVLGKAEGSLVGVCKYLTGGCRGRARLLPVLPHGRRRGNGLKLEYRKLRFNIGNMFFGVKHCYRLPRDVIKPPFLEILKA